jgi:hypothetical protein
LRRAVMGIPVSHWRFRLSGEVGFTGFTGFTLSALDLTWTLQFHGSDVIGGGRARPGGFFCSHKRQGGTDMASRGVKRIILSNRAEAYTSRSRRCV